MPRMKFTEALADAYREVLRARPEAFLIGVGITDPKAVFGSLDGLLKEFGPDRVVEGPLAEQMLTGLAFGAATTGLRPCLIHHRIDFLPLTLDQLGMHAAKWRYMFNNQQGVPLVMRGIVGRGWGNGPQHTQSLHSLAANIPGLQVVVPSTPADAKGLMISAMLGEEPVIYIDHRWSHGAVGEVPAGLDAARVPIGKARLMREGKDLTIVTIGPMVPEVEKALAELDAGGHPVSVDALDLRTVRPLDYAAVTESVRKTGRLLIADPDWPQFGVANALIGHITQKAWGALKAAPVAITWPDHPVPASHFIDKDYYPSSTQIREAIQGLLEVPRMAFAPAAATSTDSRGKFMGPF